MKFQTKSNVIKRAVTDNDLNIHGGYRRLNGTTYLIVDLTQYQVQQHTQV